MWLGKYRHRTFIIRDRYDLVNCTMIRVVIDSLCRDKNNLCGSGKIVYVEGGMFAVREKLSVIRSKVTSDIILI